MIDVYKKHVIFKSYEYSEVYQLKNICNIYIYVSKFFKNYTKNSIFLSSNCLNGSSGSGNISYT